MKSMMAGPHDDELFVAMNAYEQIHASTANKILHCLGIPAITVAVFGMLLSAPMGVFFLITFSACCVYMIGSKSYLAGLHLCLYGALLMALAFGLACSPICSSVHFFFAKLFGIGWLIQFLGHFFEKKTPEFTSHPINLLLGPLSVLYFLFPFLRSPQSQK